MKQDQVVFGGKYVAKVSGKLTTVVILRECSYGGWWAFNVETNREVRIRSAAKLRRPQPAWVMERQPRSPEELDVKPFICVRCGNPMAEGREGFISKAGFPVHVACGKSEELQEYKDANGGNGYKLNPKWFPAWHEAAPEFHAPVVPPTEY